MKKIFAKELAALAVLALAFTGCNTAFDGTSANFSEKEAQYTDRSGATQTNIIKGSVACTDSIDNTNKKNVVDVTITSFSKLNIESADAAIAFQQLTNNATTGYYPTRGAVLPKTRIKVNESYNSSTATETTVITYEVDGTGVTTNKIALFVDATKLKTKGGSAALALDGNTKRGEESDSFIKYLTANGTTTITGEEVFYLFANGTDKLTYAPTSGFGTPVELEDSSSKKTGVIRLSTTATNKKNPFVTGAADDYESGLAAGLNESVIIEYREPGKREYAEKKLSFTYHDAASTVATDPYNAHTYTADFGPFAIGTEYRVVQVKPANITAPTWYKDAYGHPAIVYDAGSGVGARYTANATNGTFTLHSSVPSYIVVTRTQATSGSDYTSSYNPTSFSKDDIKTAQASFFSVTTTDNWFQVSTTGTAELDPTAAKDFIVVDANNKKIAADVDVITYSYNDSNTLSGKVQYVKITVKDVRYRNSLPTEASSAAVADRLHVCVGAGTKIKENKMYPAQLTFGQWKDIVDDDASGYVQIN